MWWRKQPASSSSSVITDDGASSKGPKEASEQNPLKADGIIMTSQHISKIPLSRRPRAAEVADDAAVAEGALVPRISAASVVGGTSNAPVIDDSARYTALIDSWHNQIHTKCDWVAALAAYTFGSAMHVSGQSSALCTFSMWMAGNVFIMNSQYRGVFGPTPDAFRYESIASWIWMMASFQQFRQTKLLKYAGYSSWAGLGCVSYYSVRHLLNVMMEPS